MADTGLQRLVWITAQLRTYCPWTQDLTHHQLTEYLIEEAYEAVEVIESVPARRWDDMATHNGTYEALRKELGDVLFQVTLHSAIAEFVPQGFIRSVMSRNIIPAAGRHGLNNLDGFIGFFNEVFGQLMVGEILGPGAICAQLGGDPH